VVLLLIALGFLISLLSPLLLKRSKQLSIIILSAYPLSLFFYFLSNAMGGDIVLERYEWFTFIGVNVSFIQDGLSLLFSLLISGIGFLIMVYSSEYMKGEKREGRFYLFLMMFMVAMTGLVLSDNLIVMFIFWEITSISSFFLIGFKNDYEESRKSALQALYVTSGGALFMLVGIIWMGSLAGTYEFSEILQMNIKDSHYYPYILILILLGAFTKSAQFPFHFWLPNAMTAPTPVSAYLHSATMVKAGVFLLMRLNPVLGGTDFWTDILTSFGLMTMIIAAVLSVFQTDLKRVLAYSTISSLGTLVVFTGISNEFAIKAAVVFLIVHSLYKGTLFLVAGTIENSTGTRDIRNISGLYHLMPQIAIAGILAALSNSGFPPMFGFIGKELIYETALAIGPGTNIFIVVAVASNILLVVAAFNCGIMPFRGKRAETKFINPVNAGLWFSPLVLSVLGLMFGLVPGLLANDLTSGAVSSIVNYPVSIHLGLWHGFNEVLLLSMFTIAGGIGLYYYRIFRFIDTPAYQTVNKIDFSQYLDKSLKLLLKGAYHITRILQNGYLRYYLLTSIIIFLFLFGITFEFSFKMKWIEALKDIYLYEGILAGIMVVAAYIAIFTQSRLWSVISMGLVGYSVALIFVLFGAPDVAMTQFTIDTLTVILFVLILYKLPPFTLISKPLIRFKDLFFSLLFGGIITLCILSITDIPANREISNYYALSSYVIAKGKNVVNVILVDFRGLDTLIEITVLTVSAIGVYSLIKVKNKEKEV
jgi:multicomponent Na+:H+ antiporter subunit A